MKINFFKWIAGFFEDQKGSASSKRAITYVVLIMYCYLIIGSLNGKTINEMVLYSTVLLLCVGYGVITSEFLKDKSNIINK